MAKGYIKVYEGCNHARTDVVREPANTLYIARSENLDTVFLQANKHNVTGMTFIIQNPLYRPIRITGDVELVDVPDIIEPGTNAQFVFIKQNTLRFMGYIFA
jgi:hypothetical protein